MIALIAYFLGVDPGAVVNMAEQAGGGSSAQHAPQGAPSDEPGQFVAKVLGSTEEVWGGVFANSGVPYRAPTLVLYEGQVRSACGMGQAAMGPFYCPGDEKLYIDLAFFRDLQQRFRAPGDFAQAYVIAHEVAHHVQNLAGSFRKMEAARGRGSPAEQNRLSVRMELQADCYAGVWGHQKQSQGRVVPESFTHGSSEQRARWFRRGLDSGNPKSCDTFSAAAL